MSLRYSLCGSLCVVLMAFVPAANAQVAARARVDLAAAAAKRYPQPVRVGDLTHRLVLEPLESQPILGRVRAVVREGDGSVDVVVDYGGVFEFFAHPIAVPVDAMALLGQYMEIVEYTPQQLDGFASFDLGKAVPLPPEAVIRVGLARPSH